jgi:hypothetical protein
MFNKKLFNFNMDNTKQFKPTEKLIDNEDTQIDYLDPKYMDEPKKFSLGSDEANNTQFKPLHQNDANLVSNYSSDSQNTNNGYGMADFAPLEQVNQQKVSFLTICKKFVSKYKAVIASVLLFFVAVLLALFPVNGRTLFGGFFDTVGQHQLAFGSDLIGKSLYQQNKLSNTLAINPFAVPKNCQDLTYNTLTSQTVYEKIKRSLQTQEGGVYSKTVMSLGDDELAKSNNIYGELKGINFKKDNKLQSQGQVKFGSTLDLDNLLSTIINKDALSGEALKAYNFEIDKLGLAKTGPDAEVKYDANEKMIKVNITDVNFNSINKFYPLNLKIDDLASSWLELDLSSLGSNGSVNNFDLDQQLEKYKPVLDKPLNLLVSEKSIKTLAKVVCGTFGTNFKVGNIEKVDFEGKKIADARKITAKIRSDVIPFLIDSTEELAEVLGNDTKAIQTLNSLRELAPEDKKGEEFKTITDQELQNLKNSIFESKKSYEESFAKYINLEFSDLVSYLDIQDYKLVKSTGSVFIKPTRTAFTDFEKNLISGSNGYIKSDIFTNSAKAKIMQGIKLQTEFYSNLQTNQVKIDFSGITKKLDLQTTVNEVSNSISSDLVLNSVLEKYSPDILNAKNEFYKSYEAFSKVIKEYK